MPYTSKHNGLAERKNMCIVEVTRAMLHDQKLQKFLWREVTNVVVYVQNRSPHKALYFKNPEEVFYGKKLDVSHFRIFGSAIYFHVPKVKRNKLEAFGKKCIFVGEIKNSKAYIIYVSG